MSFDILYLEDDVRDRDGLLAAIEDHNSNSQRRKLSLNWIEDPDQLAAALDEHSYNLLIADLHFRPKSGRLNEFMLPDIVGIVARWSRDNDGIRPPPIIAYTRREKVELTECLKYRSALFDIWDKNSASPAYVVWRIESMIVDVSRGRPDALLEREIRTLVCSAGIHNDVRRMAREYAAAWTEADQIQRVGGVINAIGVRLNCSAYTESGWSLMAQWEPIGRALFHHTRGHARHVINVFWLGYWILNHSELRSKFDDLWSKLLFQRSGMASLRNIGAIEALNEAWFYAGLFHDVANCVQEAAHGAEQMTQILGHFKGLLTGKKGELLFEVGARGDEMIGSLGPYAPALKELWGRSVSANQPDHGVVAALFLQRHVSQGAHGCCAREASRAMVLHNLAAKLPKDTKACISWAEDPIGCLLLLCDQIQTWDRDRGDQSLLDKEGPIRAELAELDLVTTAEGHELRIWIEYVAPPHLDQDSVGYGRVKVELERVLRTHVLATLQLIQHWPFTATINFRLSGEALSFPLVLNDQV